MRYIERAGLKSSVLGFGCGAVMGRVGQRESLRAMSAAWENGVTLFDTARSYGYGAAEGVLGEFLASGGKREQAVVVTKFGILPERQQAWKQLAKPLVRGLLKLSPSARTLVRKSTAGQLNPGHFTAPVLRASLEESLRQLRTDHVDILLLHAAPASVLDQDDLFAELQNVITEGKVRVGGFSGEPDAAIAAITRGLPVLQAMQFPANIFDLRITEQTRATAGKFFCVANHPFGGVTRVEESKRLIAGLATSPQTPAELRAKLAEEESSLLADVVFSMILRHTGIDAVVPAMMRPESIATNTKVIEHSRFTDEEVDWLRQALLPSGLQPI